MNVAIFITFSIISSLGCLEAKPVTQIQARSGLLYVLKQAGSNFYKIGFTSRSVADRIKQLQTGNPQRITKKFSQKVTDVGQAEKDAKDAVKKYNILDMYQGGTEWYKVPQDEYSSFKTSIKQAIRHFRPKMNNRLALLRQAVAQMFDQE